MRPSKTVIGQSRVWKSAAFLLPAERCEKSLAWNIEYDPGVVQDLKKLGWSVQREMVDYLANTKVSFWAVKQ